MLQRILRALGRLRAGSLDPDNLSDRQFIHLAYRLILRRPPDPGGLANYLGLLAGGTMTRPQMLDNLLESREFMDLAGRDLLRSLHESRRHWTRGLPRARRILDLGGSAQGSPAGALLAMGYPYSFEELVVVDLPLEQRHPLSSAGYQAPQAFDHPQGRVRYQYSSMTELDSFPDDWADLVHSGQSIEHVSQDQARLVLAQAFRVLRPGGLLCLDTPNAAATRLQSPAPLHPDHKIEYRHEQLAAMLSQAGFEIVEAKGLNYLPQSMASGRFDPSEAARNLGVFDDIESCYLLAYRCRKPG